MINEMLQQRFALFEENLINRLSLPTQVSMAMVARRDALVRKPSRAIT